MFSFLKDYQRIGLPIRNTIAAEFFIQLVNATFMNILPLYMTREGFSGQEIAVFITFRFVGVFILAVPLGRYIKGRHVMPLFYVSNICVPLFGIAVIACISYELTTAAMGFLLLWGASFTFMQIPVLPFVLRNAPAEHQTAAITLSYSTWSFGGIVSGILIAILDFINPEIFDERAVLLIFCFIGLGGLIFLRRVKNFQEVIDETPTEPGPGRQKTDWKIVIRALVPTLIIATGAGLTIPFISLFFEKVHGLHKGGFSVLSFVTSALVAYASMLVPRIKQHVGYKFAIPATQSLAVISLVALATTEFYSHLGISVVIAAVCYLFRQPLMNMAGPMTSELILNYVGKNNREITSALTSAIWSSSWVVSGLMVSVFFALGLSFATIFLITALLYAFGVILYYLLILDNEKRNNAL